MAGIRPLSGRTSGGSGLKAAHTPHGLPTDRADHVLSAEQKMFSPAANSALSFCCKYPSQFPPQDSLAEASRPFPGRLDFPQGRGGAGREGGVLA